MIGVTPFKGNINSHLNFSFNVLPIPEKLLPAEIEPARNNAPSSVHGEVGIRARFKSWFP